MCRPFAAEMRSIHLNLSFSVSGDISVSRIVTSAMESTRRANEMDREKKKKKNTEKKALILM